MKIATHAENSPPPHLSKRSSAFWRELNNRFIFEAHDLERLRVACESMDVIDECEAAILKAGRFVKDRYGTPKAHPGVATARDARQMLLRAIRELCVDVEVPSESRVPRQSRRYG